MGADYEPATGQLRCVLAGHPLQLLFRADGRIESVRGRNTMLGLLDEVHYAESVIQLEPGDMHRLLTIWVG